MENRHFYCAGYSPALEKAIPKLKAHGIPFSAVPDSAVTHLLLPAPSLTGSGGITGGERLDAVLSTLPKEITVIGGNLDVPTLQSYKTLDLLKDPEYLVKNADITAYCAVKLAMERLPFTLYGCPVLVIGWGRIGKCLARLLRALGAQVCVSSRSGESRSLLNLFGYQAVDTCSIVPQNYKIIFNTAPAKLSVPCPSQILAIDLASQLALSGEKVLWARGLPGKMASESAGDLIANTIMNRLFEKE